MKKLLSILALLLITWSISAQQQPLQELPADCIVYISGQTTSLMKDPISGRMISLFLTKNKLIPGDLCGTFAGGITVDGSAKIVAILQKPCAAQVVGTLFKEDTRKRIRISPDNRKLTFLSAAPRKQNGAAGDRRKEFSQIVAGMKDPVCVLAFLGTDVPEGMEDNLIWSGLQRYADCAVFSMEELRGFSFLCRARIVCPTAEDAQKCSEKLNDALGVIADAEKSTDFTRRVKVNVAENVLTAEIVIRNFELLACAFRVKILLNHFGGTDGK